MIPINKAIFCGRVKFEPRSVTVGQTQKLTFVLEAQSVFTKKGGETTAVTDTMEVHVWGRDAEQAQFKAVQGVWVYVEGRLNFDSWKGDNGEQKGKTVIRAEVVRFESSVAEARPAEASLFEQPQRDKSTPF